LEKNVTNEEATIANEEATTKQEPAMSNEGEAMAKGTAMVEEETAIVKKEAALAKGETATAKTVGGISKEAAIQMIRKAAEKIGHAPSSSDLEELTPIRRWHIRRLFGSYAWALHECKLGPKSNGQKIPLDLLFTEWATTVRKLGKLPSIAEFNETSKYTTGPFQRRFLNWRRVPGALQDFARKSGMDSEWQDVMEMISQSEDSRQGATIGERLVVGMKPAVIKSDRPVYGPAMAPAAFVHEPINEMGVVFLFGAVAERLGFMVTLVQAEFPDCEALREVGPRRWQRVNIEFEYESRNFLRHGHEVSGCDMIVCWIHNWPECPLEVVELREIARIAGIAKIGN
jgi:hypothetical protein